MIDTKSPTREIPAKPPAPVGSSRPTTTLRFRAGTELQADAGAGWATLTLIPRQLRFALKPPSVLPALERLAGEGATEQELAATLPRRDLGALQSWARLLSGLRAGNWLEQTISADGGALVTLKPISALANAGPASPAADTVVVASRFTTVRRDGSMMVAESPRAGALAVLHDPRAGALLAATGAPTSQSELIDRLDGTLAADEVRAIVRLLLQGRLMVTGDADEEPAIAAERRHEAAEAGGGTPLWAEQWSAGDLFFHSRSRMGRHANPYGGTYRFVGRHDPLPAVHPRSADAPLIPLQAPDLDAVARRDPALTTAIEQRVSVRRHDDEHPIGAAQLSEFLYRTQRLRWVHDTGERGEVASRPYPSGGSLYELEVYPIVNRCDGIAAGVYRYDGDQHALERVADTGTASRDLVEIARLTSLMDAPPQVLLVVAARFGRIMWKYESVGYAVILKNVGALYQTMYLVATAMGLAGCALGGGDAEMFARVTGLRFEEESSVGEFVLGSRVPGLGQREIPAERAAT